MQVSRSYYRGSNATMKTLQSLTKYAKHQALWHRYCLKVGIFHSLHLINIYVLFILLFTILDTVSLN